MIKKRIKRVASFKIIEQRPQRKIYVKLVSVAGRADVDVALRSAIDTYHTGTLQ
jgi:hypothetical protein